MQRKSLPKMRADLAKPHPASRLAALIQRPSPPVLCALLLLLILIAFFPALGNGFINYDDGVYVTKNRHVQTGISWESIRWAFVSQRGANWHPLTWLSHVVDCQLFGLKPWGHHLTSVLIHALNTLFLFLVLKRMTGAAWRSFVVAALFALHPLHVESVAWVAERKDVLSGLFFFLTVWAYAEYVKVSSVECRGKDPSTPGHASRITHPAFSIFYVLSLFFFALGRKSSTFQSTSIYHVRDCHWPKAVFFSGSQSKLQ